MISSGQVLCPFVNISPFDHESRDTFRAPPPPPRSEQRGVSAVRLPLEEQLTDEGDATALHHPPLGYVFGEWSECTWLKPSFTVNRNFRSPKLAAMFDV